MCPIKYSNFPTGEQLLGFSVSAVLAENLDVGAGLWRVSFHFAMEGIWFYGFTARDPEDNILETGATEAPIVSLVIFHNLWKEEVARDSPRL
jgi:hypothetical protein